MRIIKIIFVTIVFAFLVSTVSAGINTNATTYLSFVNDGLGFYKVRNFDNPPRVFTYEHRVLTINEGDTMIWENDADANSFTIVSDQNLWNNNVGYLKVGHKINYKFDNPGTYTFYIKETISNRQTIIVNDLGGVATTTNPSPIVTTNTRKPSPTIPIVTTNTRKPSPTIAKTPFPIATTNTRKPSPTIAKTPFPTIAKTPIASKIINVTESKNVEIPLKITPTTVASMVVAALSFYVISRSRKKIRK